MGFPGVRRGLMLLALGRCTCLRPSPRLYGLVRPSPRFHRLPFCTATPDAEVPSPAALRKSLDKEFLRGIKKGEKLFARLRRAQEAEEKGGFGSRTEDPKEVETVLAEHLARQKEIQVLQDALAGVKSSKDAAFAALAGQALALGLRSAPQGGGKKQRFKEPPRKPYWVYDSGGVEIRVGRGAKDNDELSTGAEHRAPGDWWLHVSGFPGSHVVIHCEDDDLPDSRPEVLRDAALLTAKYSKAPPSGNTVVSFTRCRHVSKPPLAKPGLVTLSGRVGSVKVNLGVSGARIEELEATRVPPRQP